MARGTFQEQGDDEPGEPEEARTLLVDDVEALRKLYGTVLEDQGPFEVVAEAADGQAAIEAAGEHEPDLVLLDLSMPGMDGLEALPQILEASPESVVVILSGFLEKRVGERARELGAEAYIEKGTDPGAVVDRLVDVLDWAWTKPVDERGTVQPSPTPSDEELHQFAYTASHDLQEPLRLVGSYLDLFEHRYGDQVPEEGRQMLSYAANGVERMQAMVDGLLTYSRVTTRSGPPEEVDLEQTLEDAIANLALRVEVSDAELTHDELPIVIADRGQILLLFQNLLENAIKFHPGQPTIHVGASDLGGDVEITIEDDGPGIPEDHLERIFSLFERAGRQGDGHGIGLSICRRIVQWHGGSIGVSSPPGEGARFVITLPKNGPQQPEGSS